MERLLEKIDSYNLFTNIIPGYLMLIFNMYYLDLFELNIIEQILIAYFIGLTINRLGSIFTEKILLKFTKEKGESYDKYILASNNDKKINVLLQERNTYRTFCTLFIVCIIELIFIKVINIFNLSEYIVILLVSIVFSIIYVISFCKYNKYIADRIRIYNKD